MNAAGDSRDAAADGYVVVDDGGGLRLLGRRCDHCGYAVAEAFPSCPVCSSALADAAFDIRGTVWASTSVHVSVQGRGVPYGLAYVDIDGGPRMLGHFSAARPLRIGERVVASSVVGSDVQLVPEPRRAGEPE